MQDRIKQWLKIRFKDNVCFDESMRKHTTFRVGGTADALVWPNNIEELTDLLVLIRTENIPFFILGGGSNLLVKDEGIRGIVIALKKGFGNISHTVSENVVFVRVQAGVKLAKLCQYSISNGFGGMNFAVGIPGTVGGAVFMNAGTASGCMSDVLERIKVLTQSGEIIDINSENIKMSYRQFCCYIPNKNVINAIILEAGLKLFLTDLILLKNNAQDLYTKRKKSQPLNYPSAGSFFKNPEKCDPAGKLIDMAGLKGVRYGGAEISSKHANFIINRGDATADDILMLMRMAQERVYYKFGIMLEPEVKIVGQ